MFDSLTGGNFWYSLVLIWPLSGKYYLDNLGTSVKVKMVDNEVTTDVIVEGRTWRKSRGFEERFELVRERWSE